MIARTTAKVAGQSQAGRCAGAGAGAGMGMGTAGGGSGGRTGRVSGSGRAAGAGLSLETARTRVVLGCTSARNASRSSRISAAFA